MIRLKFTGRIGYRDRKGEIYYSRNRWIGSWAFDVSTGLYEVRPITGATFAVSNTNMIKDRIQEMINSGDLKL